MMHQLNGKIAELSLNAIYIVYQWDIMLKRELSKIMECIGDQITFFFYIKTHNIIIALKSKKRHEAASILITIRFDILEVTDIKPDVVHVGRKHCYCK